MTFQRKEIQIDEHPALFRDYLYNFEKVESFFSWNPHQNLRDALRSRLDNYGNRSSIVKILEDQNRRFSLSEASQKNLETLSRDNCLAVVTGQQAGIFGGPLYTVYKILTGIKLCEKMQSSYPDFSFIPVFWMEVGDNDYREINHIQLLDMTNQVKRLQLPDTPGDNRSVYLRSIPEEIDEIHDSFWEIFPSNDFRDPILNRLKDMFPRGKKFPQAFGEWIHEFFGEFGILVFDPTDPEVSGLAQPIFRKAVEQRASIMEEYQHVNTHLDQNGFHSQIQMEEKQTLLFYRGKGDERLRIDEDPDGRGFIFHTSDKPERLTSTELFDELKKHPEKFTPNVALRPVLQDSLLPTAIYVAGPGEISYAAQLKPLYRLMDVVPPVFYPRARISIVEKKIQKAIEKTELSYEEIFRERNKLADYWMKKHSEPEIIREINHAGSEIRETMERLRKKLNEFDPSLESGSEKTLEHMMDGLGRLKDKTQEAARRKKETEIRQIEKISENLFPEGHFQERFLNLLQYQVKYGPNFIKELYKTMEVELFKHQLIML